MIISAKPYFVGIKRLDTSVIACGEEIEINQQNTDGKYEFVKLNAKHKRDLYDALHREFGNA